MTCFVAVAKVSNAWIVFHSLRRSDGHAREELRDLIKKNHGKMHGNLFIEFEYYEVERLDGFLKKLFYELSTYRISNNVFNISEKLLAKIIADFLDAAMDCGLMQIYPYKNFIRKVTSQKCLGKIKINRKIKDEETYQKYLPAILKARALFEDPKVVKNVQEIVEKIYISPKHSLKHGLFDTEGKRIYKLYSNWHEWYDLGKVGTSLMVAIGAFGYENHNAILFIAFDRIKSHLSILENKNDWRSIDEMLPDLIAKKLDLLHLFSWMKQKGLLNGWQMIDAAPLAKLIPGDGLHLFQDSMGENIDYVLENFYPDLEYVLIE
jgi:hypothetical protein